MRNEYDFSKAVKGKYSERFKESANLIVLEPEVAKAFPDSKSVNEALRSLIQISNKTS